MSQPPPEAPPGPPALPGPATTPPGPASASPEPADLPSGTAAASNASGARAAPAADGWNPLPERAFPVYVLGELAPSVLLAVPPGLAGFFVGHLFDARLTGGLAGMVLGFGLGLLAAMRRFGTIRWRLDAQGLAVRRGRLWQQETRVPLTRVQHLDLTRGPLQRSRGLATLVIHTAGSRHSAVSVPDLDLQDAEQLRDQLGRQLEDDRDGDD